METRWPDMLTSARIESLATSCLRIAVIVAAAWAASIVLKKVLRRFRDRLVERGALAHDPAGDTLKRADTLTRLVRQASLVGIWVVAGLVVLKELGIEIGPILAGAGVVGLAVGFGAQNLVRDIISGFFFILEDQVRVGDVAVVNGTGGLVEQINLRTIVLRDLEGTVHVFPHGSVTTLSNRTKNWSAYVFDIGVAYKEDVDTVMKTIASVGEEMRQEETFGPLMLDVPEIFGLDRFDDSAVVIKGRIRTKPLQQWAVGREFLRRIKYAFDASGIEIPFPHRTVYFGEQGKAHAPMIAKGAPPDRPPEE